MSDKLYKRYTMTTSFIYNEDAGYLNYLPTTATKVVEGVYVNKREGTNDYFVGRSCPLFNMDLLDDEDMREDLDFNTLNSVDRALRTIFVKYMSSETHQP